MSRAPDGAPTRWAPRLVPRSIAGRLTFWFLAIALVPCLALTVLLDRISSRSIAETVERNLGVIQAARASELEQYAQDRVRYGTALSRAPAFVEAAERLAEVVGRAGRDSAEYREAAGRYRVGLSHAIETLGHPQFAMFSPDGGLLLRSAEAPDPGPSLETGPLRDSPLARLVGRMRALLTADLSAFATYPGRGEAVAFVGTPLLGGTVGWSACSPCNWTTQRSSACSQTTPGWVRRVRCSSACSTGRTGPSRVGRSPSSPRCGTRRPRTPTR
jgi:hypothetical protein